MSKTLMIGGGAGVGAALTTLAVMLATPQITEFEGVRYEAYRDVVGILTVCTGSTGPEVVKGKKYTKEECDKMTEKDVKIHMNAVLKYSPHLLFHPVQLAAATSFTYNVGEGAYAKSTVKKLFNSGDFIGACNYLPKYKYAGGKVVQGLVNRRAKEQAICLSTLTA